MPGTLVASPASTITNPESSDADMIVEQLGFIIEEAEDKDKVKKSIRARLYATAIAREPSASVTSSMDADIDELLSSYEGDGELMSEVEDRMKGMLGGRRRRKTRKVTKKRQTRRKYSRRH